MPVISLSAEQKQLAWHIVVEETDDDKVFVVSGHKIEKFALRTDFDNIHGLNRLRDIMKKMGISHELRRKGAEGTSLIRIGDAEFTLVEQ